MIDQFVEVASRQIGTTDAALKQDIAGEHAVFFFAIIYQAAGRMSGDMDRFQFGMSESIPEGYELPASDDFYHPSIMRNQLETFSFLQPAETEAKLKSMSVPYTDLHCEQVNLEDAFIGLTGKY